MRLAGGSGRDDCRPRCNCVGALGSPAPNKLLVGVGDGTGDELNAELFVNGGCPLTRPEKTSLDLYDLNSGFPTLGMGNTWSWRSKLITSSMQ